MKMPFLPQWKFSSFRVACLVLVSVFSLTALAACGSEAAPEAPLAAANSSNTPTTSTPATGTDVPAEPTILDPVPLVTPADTMSTMTSDPASPLETAATVPVMPIVRASPTQAPRMAPTGSPETAASDGNDEGDGSDGSAALEEVLAQPDTTWGDVFNTFSEEEQSCIRGEVGDERLDSILGQPYGLQGLENESVSVLECISDEQARTILLADLSSRFPGLTEDQKICLGDLLGTMSPVDLASAMGPEPTQEQAFLMLSFSLGMVACVPQLAENMSGGPTGVDGISGDTVIQSDTRLWTFTTGGWVVTAPAVAEGMVYAGSDDYSLYALNAQTGNLVWSHATGDVIRSTPTIVDGKVYFGSNDNHLYALDAATGELLWRFDTGGWVQYSTQVGHGAVYLPVQGDAGQKVVALDAATGETKWAADVAARIDPTYTPSVSGNHVYVAGATYGAFYALDAATGDVAWRADVGSYVESNPTVLDGVVYLTVVNHAYALNEMTGEIIWSVSTEEFPARDFPAVVVDGVYYLAPSNNVYALNDATGEELWSYESFMLSTAPVVAEGVLYGASGDGGFVFALDVATGQELWKESTGGQVIQSLTAMDGLLFGESDSGTLIAADGESGVPVWAFEKGGFSDVRGYTVKDGVVYSAGPNNSVYAHTAP